MLPALVILWLAASLSNMTSGTPVKLNAQQASQEEAWKEAFPDFETKLYAGVYLRDTVQSTLQQQDGSTDRSPVIWLLPTVIFLLASIVAFATGTSWGTMGIVMPMAVPLAYSLLAGDAGEVSVHDPLLLCTIGSVLAGAIFGDHCSPISDTTVLSSQASGCDHIAHVWTQLPYALAVGAIAVLFGTLPVGLGVNVWWLLPIGIVAMVTALLLFGRRVE